jgi:hypothetical protein
MVKKGELKRRAIYVYPPAEMAARWKGLAEAAGTSISKFVMEHVENSLGREEEGYSSRSVVIEENRHLRESLKEKEKRGHHLEILVEKLEEDLRTYRARMFTDPSFSGIRSYDKRLVEILKQPGAHTSEELLSRLGIKPREQEAVKAVSVQLENLQGYGLVRSSRRGWVWTHDDD